MKGRLVMVAARRNKFLVVADDSPEFKSALRYCSRRAKNTGGSVTLLRIIEPADFQHWVSVGELMREEAREEAAELLQDLVNLAFEWSDVMPEVVIREGDLQEEILKFIDEDENVRILVLGASSEKDGPGPLVSRLAGQVSGQLHVPLIIVPGSMTAEEIDAVT
jgi:hypothetical protein